MVYRGHTAKAAVLTELFLQAFPFHAALMAAGERLAAGVGLTAARWQVLSVVARADQPEPVAHVARTMGLARQSVQRLADELVRSGLVRYGANPHHKRASLLHLTDKGRKAFDEITMKQVPWANALAKDLDSAKVTEAVLVLRKLTEKLEQRIGE